MNNLDPKGTIKTHPASGMRMLANIGLFSNPMRLRFLEPETVTKVEADKMVSDAVAGAKAESGKSWFGGLSADLSKHPTMEKFSKSSIDDVASSYINLQSLINEKGTIVPKEGASEETIKAFHKSIGVPDKIEGYAVPKIEGLHKNAVSEAGGLKLIQEACLKSGITPKGFNAIYETYMRDVSGKLTAWDNQQTKDYEAAETALRGEWGGNFPMKQALAAKIIATYGGEELINLLKESGQANNPVIMKCFANIGAHLSEDSLGKLGVSNLSMTKSEAQGKIDEMRDDPKSSFNDPNHRGHDEAVKYMTTLYEIRDATG